MRAPLILSTDQRQQLLHCRDYHPKPYVRERAAALLKVADGASSAQVAHHGLLRPRRPETVAAWVHRYRQDGAPALTIRSGRGRKPAFSPSRPHR